jgi:LPXTG-site transpeptidase (sortase) family protein
MSKKFFFILIICSVVLCLAVLCLVSLQSINDTNQEYKYNGYTLLIPKINLSVELNNQSLNAGALMDNKSSVPGSGPVYIFGHRLSMNSVFLRIDELREGDPVSIISPSLYVCYKVDSISIVNPDYKIPVYSDDKSLYLVSCYPIGSTAKRIIVICSSISS